MKLISIFNHKGGVGKTTITYNLAFALAELGSTVVMADLDPQANLSIMSLDNYEGFIDEGGWTISSGLQPLVSGEGDYSRPELQRLDQRVFLLPCDIDLADFESILPTAWTECLAGQTRGFRVTSAIGRMLFQASEEVDADYVLIDLGPNIGGLNRAVLMSSGYFIVPMTADLFSVKATKSVGRNIVNWVRDWENARQRFRMNEEFSIPDGRCHFLGYITQQFNIYRNRPTEAFKHWKTIMPEAVSEGIIETLSQVSLSDPAASNGPEIGDVQNFHSLAPKAQEHRKPIFRLSNKEGIFGNNLERVDQARESFSDIARKIRDWTS